MNMTKTHEGGTRSCKFHTQADTRSGNKTHFLNYPSGLDVYKMSPRNLQSQHARKYALLDPLTGIVNQTKEYQGVTDYTNRDQMIEIEDQLLVGGGTFSENSTKQQQLNEVRSTFHYHDMINQ